MFCGLLLSTSQRKTEGSSDISPLFAQTTDLNVRVVSGSGQGSVDLSYVVDKQYDSLVYYVPHLIAHQGMTRQRVRLTHCQALVTNINTGRTEDCTLEVSKLVTEEYLENIDSLPSYSELKKQYKNILSTYAGAHSSEDVFLHFGNLQPPSQLNLHVEFLVSLDSPTSLHQISFEPSLSPTLMPAPHWQYLIHNVLPTKRLKYSLTIAASLPIEKVVASPPFEDKLQWMYTGKDELHQNVVYVFCDLESPVEFPYPLSTGFSVIYSTGVLSSCYTCLTDDSVTKRSNSCITDQLRQRATSSMHQQNWDTIMALNITLSRDQLPFIQQHQVYPSEFVFVIDCSGSMSGSNIQSATDMLVMCVKSLPSGCYFNVIAFGSHFRQLFHASEKYSKHTVERAVLFANQLQATLGGTDLLPPLQWIFKKASCDSLPRQLFIVTDGGVTNTQQVINLIKRNKKQARCHTFGIGSEVCIELVTGIAAISGGKCVLLKEGERLQTKVMEVFKESLQPTITDVLLKWNVPHGYILADTTPNSFHTMYVGNSYTAYAFLQRDDCEGVTHDKPCTGSATIAGVVGDDDVEISVKPTTLSSLTPAQNTEIASIINQNAIWLKLLDLEQQAAMISKPRSRKVCEPDGKPVAKRPCLNGPRNVCDHSEMTPSIHKLLLDISLLNHIPSPLTYFASMNTSRKILQILPYEKNNNITRSSVADTQAHHRGRHYRRRFRHRRRYLQSSNQASFSLASFTRNTISSVSSRLKSIVGLFIPETNPGTTDDIQMLEDEVEYQEKKGSQLQLDISSNLVYPSFYYNCPVDDKVKSKIKPSQKCVVEKNEMGKPTPPLEASTSSVITQHSSVNENELTISDTESDSSVDPDWDGLRKPSDHLPLIHLQLFSGAWPLVRPFSYAVGVPLDEIRKLPLNESRLNPTAVQMSPHYSGDIEDEANAHFWCTALAVTCLEEYFSHLPAEWELVAYKGKIWLEQNQYQCNITLAEVYHIAQRLVRDNPS